MERHTDAHGEQPGSAYRKGTEEWNSCTIGGLFRQQFVFRGLGRISCIGQDRHFLHIFHRARTRKKAEQKPIIKRPSRGDFVRRILGACINWTVNAMDTAWRSGSSAESKTKECLRRTRPSKKCNLCLTYPRRLLGCCLVCWR